MVKDLNFFDLDERLYEKKFELSCDEDSIYIIHYNNDNKNISVSYGTINNFNNSKIRYSGNINSNIGICPIFNLFNNKIIGIHQCFNKYFNKGIFMNEIIHKFIDFYQIKKLKINKIKPLQKNKLFNEIEIFMDIYTYKPNEKIFFLNSKKLNEKNTEIIINNEKYEYNQYFIPTKIGKYNITLKLLFNIEDFSYMFKECKNIKRINFINFNNANIIKMNNMFEDCQELERINFFSFNTENVIDMSYLFYNCKNLKYIDLLSFDTKNVTNMNYMFYGCESLNYIDLNYLNTHKVTDMSYMFSGCCKLKNLDLSKFNSKNVSDMSNMFSDCENLVNLDLSSFNTQTNIKTSKMFCNCKNYSEFLIEFISEIEIENIKDNLFNKIRNL